MDRRDFLQTSLGASFAAAVLPTPAEATITTDATGIDTGTFPIQSGTHSMPVYMARPAGKQNLPVVLVVSEIFGVHQHIADIARRFARLGYLALAPDLFGRQGDPTGYTSIPELFKDIITKTPDADAMQDLDACVAAAADHGGDTSRLAITGFCWGGRITWLYAAHNPQVKAGVAWYGKLAQDKTSLQPLNPLDIAAGLRVPVLGLYGGKDTSIPLESVERMRAELAKGKSGAEFVIYPDAGHAFHADYRPSYVASDAKDGWLRCIAWLRRFDV
jgi:carboxymethylenebutenolidase